MEYCSRNVASCGYNKIDFYKHSPMSRIISYFSVAIIRYQNTDSQWEGRRIHYICNKIVIIYSCFELKFLIVIFS